MRGTLMTQGTLIPTGGGEPFLGGLGRLWRPRRPLFTRLAVKKITARDAKDATSQGLRGRLRSGQIASSCIDWS